MPLGYIYKLESSFEDPGIYVGSTVNMRTRKNKHKSNCNNSNSNKYNYKLYQYIRDYGGFNNWFMLTLEEFEYEELQELRKREDYWIKELKADLNGKDAVQDKERLKIYYKNYYEKNKEKRNEKIYCECGGKYTYKNKARHIKSPKHQSYLSSKVI